MFQTPFSDAIRNDLQIATMAVGNITSPDQVNTIVLSGRADLVALGRPHLSNPHFTNLAAAHYGYAGAAWPVQYGPGKEQAYRLAERANSDDAALRAQVTARIRPKLVA